MWRAAPDAQRSWCPSTWPDMLIKTSSGHDYSAWSRLCLANVALSVVMFLLSLERLQKRTQILTQKEWKVSVKTGSLDIGIRCISSTFLTRFHSGGPFGGICASARLDNSAVPRVCEETLERCRLIVWKMGLMSSNQMDHYVLVKLQNSFIWQGPSHIT